MNKRLKNFECHSTVSRYHFRKYLNYHKHTIDKNKDFKGVDGKDLEADEEHATKNRGKGNHLSGQHFTELCLTSV